MAIIAFYLLASLIFVNASAVCIALLSRIYDYRYRFMLVLSMALSISTFTSFFNTNWSILMTGFGIYCLGLIVDTLFFSPKSHNKLKLPFIGIYCIAAAGTFLAFFMNLKILFLVTYLGYWIGSFLLNKGYFNHLFWSTKENKH